MGRINVGGGNKSILDNMKNIQVNSYYLPKDTYFCSDSEYNHLWKIKVQNHITIFEKIAPVSSAEDMVNQPIILASYTFDVRQLGNPKIKIIKNWVNLNFMYVQADGTISMYFPIIGNPNRGYHREVKINAFGELVSSIDTNSFSLYSVVENICNKVNNDLYIDFSVEREVTKMSRSYGIKGTVCTRYNLKPTLNSNYKKLNFYSSVRLYENHDTSSWEDTYYGLSGFFNNHFIKRPYTQRCFNDNNIMIGYQYEQGGQIFLVEIKIEE